MSRIKKIESLKYIVLGMLISGVMFGTGAHAATVISANRISYTDNSSLGATDVQAAIDGTCTKVDTRLGSLEKNNLTTTGKVTANIKYTTTSSNNCEIAYKYGNVVMYSCFFVPTSTSTAAGTTLFTLPTGFRPPLKQSVTILASGTGTAYNAHLNPDGTIIAQNNALESRWYQFSVTFIAA